MNADKPTPSLRDYLTTLAAHVRAVDAELARQSARLNSVAVALDKIAGALTKKNTDAEGTK